MRIVPWMSLALAAALSLGAVAQGAPDAGEAAAKPLPKAAPKKAPAKKHAPKQAAKPAKPEAKEIAPGLTRYKNAKDAPTIRDAQGNINPTSPEAYDVSSAMGKKK